MEKFRNLTNNIFFKVFLSFVGLSFITFGVSDLVFESNNSWVAKINGKKINQINFERKLEAKKYNLYGKTLPRNSWNILILKIFVILFCNKLYQKRF